MYRYFLALRYLLSRPINLIGMAGVTVSVWALIVVVSIFSGFLVEVRAHIKAASADLTVRFAEPRSFAEIQQILESDPNVAACAPRLVWYGLLHALGATHEIAPSVGALGDSGDANDFVNLLGVDPEAEARVTGFRGWLDIDERAVAVRDPNAPFDPVVTTDGTELPAILLSEKRLAMEFVEPGAVAEVTTARPNEQANGGTVLNFVPQRFGIAGAYATKHHAFDSNHCFVDIGVLREVLGTPAADAASEVIVRCHDATTLEETADRLSDSIYAKLPNAENQVDVRTWEELNWQILSAVTSQRSLMKLVLFVIMVVAAFLMYATLSMMVTEKTRDIGILTAMGATRRGVLQVFLTCGLAIVVGGSVLGVITGCLSAIYLDPFNKLLDAAFGINLFPPAIYNLDHVPHDLDPLWIAQVAAMALGVGLLVSGLPAWRAARHHPLESLRNE